MSFAGTIQNGVVVFDNEQQLPDGTRVEVIVQEAAVKQPTLRERLAKLAGTVDDLPADMARNHDHYIHGAPEEMMRVFADTFYFLALLNKRDESHAKAVSYSPLIGKLITTEWVLTELADGLASSRHRNMFVETRQELLADVDAEVVPFDQRIYEEGIFLYHNRPDKEWSLTDCISFVVMKRESIVDALTGDHHFEQAGFVALLK